MVIEDIIENFDLLEEWDDRYRYLIELGRTLEPLPKEAYSEANKVRGCASQVWLDVRVEEDKSGEKLLLLRGDSDAHIVRGLVALVLALYSGRSATEIVATDAQPLFEKLGLAQHLTPQRANGLRSMVERIKAEARAA
jgi:cysteine desulfuration protein SufE